MRRRALPLRARGAALLVAWLSSSVVVTGCFFSPSLDEHGYTRCAAEGECAPGRGCLSGLCTPPPWNDDAFAQRRLLVVKNASEQSPLVAGAALPVRIGAGGLLPTDALGVDGRLTFYSFAAGAWRAVPVWRDIYDDHLLLYAPVQEEVPAGKEAAFVWIETQTGTRDPGFSDDAAAVFPLLFDELEGEELDEARWRSYGTGAPTVSDGRVNVADNQRLVSRVGLAPPFSLTFKGRINGVTCDALYVGLNSDDGVSDAYPSVGFFVRQDLATLLEVAPTEDSVPQQPPDLDDITLDTALHRFQLDVGSQKVRFGVDGELVGEPATLRFEGEELYFTIDVDGACSFDLEVVHASPLPFARPELRAGEAVVYEIVE